MALPDVSRVMIAGPTHQLVPAYNGHEAQRLDSVFLRAEGLPVVLGSLVAEHDVAVHVGVEVLDVFSVAGHRVCKRRDTLRVRATGAPVVVAGTALLPVAVYVQVGQLTVFALDVHDPGRREVVAAVREGCGVGKEPVLAVTSCVSRALAHREHDFQARLGMHRGNSELGTRGPRQGDGEHTVVTGFIAVKPGG
jgi:hypothetical protein